MIERLIGYHTCRLDGGEVFLLENAPFLSKSKNQWLTQGYYFWTDSPFFAHRWGEDSYDGAYAITKCTIELEKSKLLDLVGNVSNQLYFEQLIQMYKKKLSKSAISARSVPTVEATIAHFRSVGTTQSDLFPFIAIKAFDNPAGTCRPYPFIASRRAAISIPTRQQLCLFECGRRAILCKEGEHPPSYVSVASQINSARLERRNGPLS